MRNLTDLILSAPSITTGDSASSTDAPDYKSLPLSQLSKWILEICLPVIFTLGVFGNVMTITILRRFQAHRSALDRYFLCLAVTDLCVDVLGPLLNWVITVTDFELFGFHDVVCKAGLFLLNTTANCSAWLIVAMVTHRAVSVAWPHRVNVLCTAKTSWTIIVSIVVAISLAYSHFLYGMEVSGGVCRFKKEYIEFMTTVWVNFNLLLYSALPFLCLTIGNIVLVVKLRTSLKEAGDQFAATDGQQTKRERNVNSISLTALVVSVSFIVFTLPIAIKDFTDFRYTGVESPSVKDIHELAHEYFVHSVCVSVLYLNYAMNFYLYCMTGQRFRNEFAKIMSGLIVCTRSSEQ